MHNLKIIVICIIILWIGVLIGYLIGAYVTSRHITDGEIHIKKEEDKLTYSLEFPMDPEFIQNKKEVRFKVISPE